MQDDHNQPGVIVPSQTIQPSAIPTQPVSPTVIQMGDFQQPNLKKSKRKPILFGCAALVVLAAAGLVLYKLHAPHKTLSSTTAPTSSTVNNENKPKSAAATKDPAAPTVTPKTTSPTTSPKPTINSLVPIVYDNGQGVKFNMTFYSNPTVITAKDLPDSSLMGFIADTSNILKQTNPPAGVSALLFNITAGSDTSDYQPSDDTLDNCDTAVFTVTIAGNPAKVCNDSGHTDAYFMEYKYNGTYYFATAINASEGDLTPYNSDLQTIFASIKNM